MGIGQLIGLNISKTELGSRDIETDKLTDSIQTAASCSLHYIA